MWGWGCGPVCAAAWGLIGVPDPIDWPTIIANYRFEGINGPCWRELSEQRGFGNNITVESAICELFVWHDVPTGQYKICNAFNNPLRYISSQHIMESCDHLIIGALAIIPPQDGDSNLNQAGGKVPVVDAATQPAHTINPVSFQHSPSIDSTFVLMAAATGPHHSNNLTNNVMSFASVIVDTAQSAVVRGYVSLVHDLGYVQTQETVPQFVNKRVFPFVYQQQSRYRQQQLRMQFARRYHKLLQQQNAIQRSNMNTDAQHSKKHAPNFPLKVFESNDFIAPMRILFVRPGWRPSPISIGRHQCECLYGVDQSCPHVGAENEDEYMSAFDRFVPFIHSVRGSKHMSVEFFDPTYLDGFNDCEDLHERIQQQAKRKQPHKVHTFADAGIGDPTLFKCLEKAEWMSTLEHLTSKSWMRNAATADQLQRYLDGRGIVLVERQQDATDDTNEAFTPSNSTMEEFGFTDSDVQQLMADAVIEAALKLIAFFNTFDVIVYSSKDYPLSSHMSVWANLIYLAHKSVSVRYVHGSDIFLVEYSDWAPSDAVIQDSSSYNREVTNKTFGCVHTAPRCEMHAVCVLYTGVVSTIGESRRAHNDAASLCAHIYPIISRESKN
jgi:hypothetical protein